MSYATYEEQMMTEALEEHNKDCCTEDAPCRMRTAVSKVLASHKMTPDFRVREERKTQTGNGTGWIGQGRVWEPAKKTSRTAPTDAQLRFFNSLMDQLREFGYEDRARAIEDVWVVVTDFAKYSTILDDAKRRVQTLRTKAQTSSTPAAPKKTGDGLTEGMYKLNDQIYKVRRSEAGYLYALLLTEDGFQFAKGAIRNIKPEHRMTLEEAKAYGRQTGTCCQCGRELTNETSIREGIGPVCGGRI